MKDRYILGLKLKAEGDKAGSGNPDSHHKEKEAASIKYSDDKAWDLNQKEAFESQTIVVRGLKENKSPKEVVHDAVMIIRYLKKMEKVTNPFIMQDRVIAYIRENKDLNCILPNARYVRQFLPGSHF